MNDKESCFDTAMSLDPLLYAKNYIVICYKKKIIFWLTAWLGTIILEWKNQKPIQCDDLRLWQGALSKLIMHVYLPFLLDCGSLEDRDNVVPIFDSTVLCDTCQIIGAIS